MDLFNANEFKDDELFKGTSEVPEGEYMGTIIGTEAVTSQAGHNGVQIELSLDNGMKLRDRLNLEHPTAGEFARKTLARIIKGAFKNPTGIRVTTTIEAAKLLKTLPVAVKVVHKGTNDKGYMQYNIYYNPVSEKLTYGEAPKLSY